jgi:hypothetical protein
VRELFWLMRIGVCACVSAGDPGGARVPGALHGEGTVFSSVSS